MQRGNTVWPTRILLTGIATLVLAAGIATAGFAGEPTRTEQIEALVQEYADNDEFSGVLLVADRDGIVAQRAYGPAVREWNVPNTLNTRFRIGSLTKQFTAALILTFVQEGKLDLDTRLGDVLSWYRQDTGQRVTIRQLLNHTSGINRADIMKMIQGAPATRISLREEVETYCSGDFETEPGENFAYNNSGYVILSAVVEELAGVPYAEVLAERITKPCGLENTGLFDPREMVDRLAIGYDRTDDGWARPTFIDGTLATGAGGGYSTVGDMYLWDQVLYTDQILGAETRREMFTAGPGPYGHGWFVMNMPVGPGGAERKVVRHPGQGDGYHSICWRIPDDHVTVILIANAYRLDLDSIAEGVLGILYE